MRNVCKKIHLRRVLSGCLALLVMLFAGCEIQVATDYDPSINFSGLQGYCWVDKPAAAGDDPRVYNAIEDARVKRFVNTELMARGYKLVEKSQATFLVDYHLAILQKLSGSSFGGGVGFVNPGMMIGGGVEVHQYEEKEVIIDFIHPKTGSLMWRGSARQSISSSPGVEQRDAQMSKIVAAILSKFPP